MKPELRETITNLGLEYALMTQFTSFVAVEEMIVTDGGQPRRIDVPVEVPEGVNREAIFGAEDKSFASFGRNITNMTYLAPGATPGPAQTVVVTRSGSSKAKPEA